MKVLIVDDHAPFRQGMHAVLATSPAITSIAEADGGEHAVRSALALRPDVVLMDLRMPQVDGIAATRRILAHLPRTRILALTTFNDDRLISAALDAGAAGYLLKGSPPDGIVEIMQIACRGYTMLSPGVSATNRAPRPEPDIAPLLARVAQLSDRNREILILLGRGFTNREIATHLSLAEGTVKNAISTLLATLRLRHRTEAALIARFAVETDAGE